MPRGYGDDWRNFGALAPKRSKFGNVPQFVLSDLRMIDADSGPLPPGAVRFDSKREAMRYVDLRLMQSDGKISGLELQPRFSLTTVGVDGVKREVGSYRGDFAYTRDGQRVIEDSKSPAAKTEAYQMRKRHMKAEHGIEVVEV